MAKKISPHQHTTEISNSGKRQAERILWPTRSARFRQSIQSKPTQPDPVLDVAGVDDGEDFVSFGNNGFYRTQPKLF